MNMNRLAYNIATTTVIFLACFGCKYIQSNKNIEIPIETSTKITKEVLQERLNTKGVKIIEISPSEKPNPLRLVIKFVSQGYPLKLNLNGDNMDFDQLVEKLKSVFSNREKAQVYIEETTEIDKRINLAAGDDDISYYNKENIKIEDFENLVNDLHKEGIDQLYVRFGDIVPKISGTGASSTLPTIDGGVVNGKATNLIQPLYPPAAKVVHASGIVNVQVLIDEQGNVVLAQAISGNPLLRASAQNAAHALKFEPTKLSGKPVRVTGIVRYNFPVSE